MTTLLENTWKAVNAEGSPWPLILSALLWGGAFLFCQVPSNKTVFHRWDLMHNTHNFGTILLACLSLYYDDDAIFHERLVVCFNLLYFVAGLVDNAIRKDVVYVIHDLVTLVCGYYAFTVPVVMELRIPSRMSFMELSSPLLYRAKRTRSNQDILVFMLAFIVCRVVYVPPFLMKPLIEHGVRWTEGPMVVLTIVYALQLYWLWRMVRVVVRMKKSGDTKVEKGKEA